MTDVSETEVIAAAIALVNAVRSRHNVPLLSTLDHLTDEHAINYRNDARAALTAAAQVREPPARDTDRESLAMMMLRHGFATGHGDTIADLIGDLDAQLQQETDRSQPALMPIYGATEPDQGEDVLGMERK